MKYFKLKSFNEAKKIELEREGIYIGRIYGVEEKIYKKLTNKRYIYYPDCIIQPIECYGIRNEYIDIIDDNKEKNYLRFNLKFHKVKDSKIINFLSKEKKNNRSPTEVLRILYNKIYGENKDNG